MPRIFKGIESELRLLLHPCILTGEITDIKIALFTNDPSVAIEFTDRYTIDDNILTLTVPTWAFGTMEDGVINYVIQGMHNDDAFITDRQSNYYLKTPTDYIPEEMPKEVVLGEFTTMIVENGVFEYTPSDVDAWNKATIEVNVSDTNGSYDEGYDKGKIDGYDSGYQDGYNQGQADCPEGGDNYNRVFANTFELLEYMEAQGITELNDICLFGTVGAIQNISDGKATYVLDAAMVIDGSRFDYDPDFDETKLKIGAQIALKGDAVYNVDAEYFITINNSFLINYELGQAKRYTATSNGSVYIDPDYDKGYTKLNTVILDVEVEGGANLSEFYSAIKENGTYEYLPSDTGVDGFSKVTINAKIPTPKASVKTEAEVKSIIDTDGRVENVYIQGAVTEIEQYRNGRLTFWIGGLRIGNAKDVGGVNFTDENKIKVGDNVIIFSTSGMYAISRERYEFNNCELIAICTNENGGSCNIQEYKWVRPSMAEAKENGDIYIYPDDGYDAVGYIDLDPSDIYNEGYEQGKAEGGESGDCNLINPIIFSESEGNAINAESVEIPTFAYEGNQHYNVWALNMAEYEEFKIRIRFQPTNGGNEEPVNIFGCENTDWDDTTFGARIYMGNIYFRMSGDDVAYPYSDNAWYDVEMGYNSSKRWVIVNGETLFENDHSFFNKPNQPLMMGAINSGGNAFRPFYGKIATTYIEANGNQVWLLPKEEGHMDVYWNDRSSPWIAISGENNARFEKEFISGDGMKTITWLGKKEAPTKDEVQGQVDQYTRPAVIFEGVTEVFVEEPHKLQTDDLVEATAWISTKDTVNNKWCLWTKEGKYEGVSVLNGSAFGGDYFEAKCIRLTGITKLFSATFFPISAEEIHFGSIEYIETSAIESMNELKKIFYTGDGNVTIDNNAIRGANPNGTLYLKNGVDETPWLERLPEGWVVERLNDDGSVNCGGADIEDYAKNQARVLNVTENGVYTSKYSNESEFIVGGTSQVTGIYDDGTEFYDTAVIYGALIPLNIVPTVDSRIEFWYLPNKPHMGDGFHQIIQSTNGQIAFVFDGGGVENKKLNFVFGDKNMYYTPSNIGDEWWHIIVDKNGLIFNGEEFPFDATATFKKAETNVYVNGSKLNNRKANGTFGMVKIDGTTFIPKEGGYLNLTTNELCPLEQNNIGILDDGTPITKGAFLDYSVYDTGLKITEDSVIDMWFVRPTNKIDGYVFKSPLFNVRYDSNKYYIMTNGVEQGVYEYAQTQESVINITISKADGFKKIGTYATKTISLSDAVLSSGNHTLLLDSKYNTYGLIKIDGNVIIPTENGFLNTTTNEYLKKVEEYGGEYVYMNPFYEYVNNTEKTPIEIDGNLIKTVNVNVVPKIKLADEKFSFRQAQFTKIPEWADIDGIEDMSNFFENCSKLTEIRWFDASRTTNMSSTFLYCSEFTHFPALNTIRVTKMDSMFNACNKMVSVPPLDARNVKKHTYGPIGSWTLSNLTDFGGLIGLRASMDGGYGFDKCPNLSYQSCINILNGLYDFVGNGETPASNEGKFKVHSNFLTTVGDEISIGVQKGWTITA